MEKWILGECDTCQYPTVLLEGTCFVCRELPRSYEGSQAYLRVLAGWGMNYLSDGKAKYERAKAFLEEYSTPTR